VPAHYCNSVEDVFTWSEHLLCAVHFGTVPKNLIEPREHRLSELRPSGLDLIPQFFALIRLDGFRRRRRSGEQILQNYRGLSAKMSCGGKGIELSPQGFQLSICPAGSPSTAHPLRLLSNMSLRGHKQIKPIMTLRFQHLHCRPTNASTEGLDRAITGHPYPHGKWVSDQLALGVVTGGCRGSE
jgi:hypothetical protein